jgi:hypothetical protein
VTTLHQKSIKELMKEPPWPEPIAPKVFVPTKADKKKGKWAVIFEERDEAGDPHCTNKMHVIPTIGINHQITEDCWCEPCFQETKRGSLAVVHNVSQ